VQVLHGANSTAVASLPEVITEVTRAGVIMATPPRKPAGGRRFGDRHGLAGSAAAYVSMAA
jgi:hypothetical protein